MTITEFGVAVVDGDTHLSKWIVQHGRLDIARNELLQFQRYIPMGGLVIDAGACLGDHTATYSEFVGPAGLVIAYEPNPAAFECLAFNMAKYPNVRAINAALGRETGRMGLVQNDNIGACRLAGAGALPVERLDDARFDRPLSFMKIDVEGFEPNVIAGGMETLRRDRPVLLVEINHGCLSLNGCTADDVIRPLQELGYRVQPAESHWTMDLAQLDVLCLPT